MKCQICYETELIEPVETETGFCILCIGKLEDLRLSQEETVLGWHKTDILERYSSKTINRCKNEILKELFK